MSFRYYCRLLPVSVCKPVTVNTIYICTGLQLWKYINTRKKKSGGFEKNKTNPKSNGIDSWFDFNIF